MEKQSENFCATYQLRLFPDPHKPRKIPWKNILGSYKRGICIILYNLRAKTWNVKKINVKVQIIIVSSYITRSAGSR